MPAKLKPVDEALPETGFRILRGIGAPPLPRAQACKYPFDQLAVGDAFDVPLAGIERPKVRSAVSVACSNAGKRLNAKFVTRTIGNAIRVYRTA